MVPDRIERETIIAAPVRRVWALLTEAEHIGRWFGDAGAEIDLRPSGALTVRWNEHGEIRARIEKVQPPHAFSYRWSPFRWSDAAAADELTESNSTLVEFALRADGDRTVLRVVESGFAGVDCSEAQRAEQFRDNTAGWAMELGELADHAQRAAA